MSTSTDLNFMAIDFETANESRASVCQVGLTRVIAGEVQGTDVWDVIPPTGLDNFRAMNVAVHGITAERAAAGVSWDVSLERIMGHADDLPLVEYGNFDRGVFTQATALRQLPLPSVSWHDASALARRVLQLPSHRLPEVCGYLGVPLTNHHDALADATAAAEVVRSIAQRESLWTVPELWPARARTDSRFNSRANKAKLSEMPQPNPDADPSHPLFGQNIVLTGEIEGWDLFENIADVGATPQKGVTMKTTMLVAAKYSELPTGYDPATGSGKEKKAAGYRAKGRPVTFISGGQLIRMLDQGGD
jgi:DNA polymerase-3 subunit epsilon